MIQPNRNLVEFGPSPHGIGQRLEAIQFLAERRELVFEFFSNPLQLEMLTPPWLQFCVQTPAPIDLKEGARIDYRLSLHGIPIRWQSRIDVWEPPRRFVDVQTHGPYRHWRHEHLFEEAAGGTICRDIVDYAVPGGCLVDRLLVRRDVKRIFEFRQRKLEVLLDAHDRVGANVAESMERNTAKEESR
jgi:ligand-binding SRPBCC domain-containing protein